MASTVMQNGSLVVARVLPAQAEELVAVDAAAAAGSRRSSCSISSRREDVVAGRHRRVGGEDGAGRDGLAGLGEVERCAPP